VTQVLLTRYYSAFGVHGTLETPNNKLYTIEKPWIHNQLFISCIPEGSYICKKYESTRHGLTFEVIDVEGRTHILFHKANSPKDVKGCIGIGRSWCIHENLPWIMDSYKGFTDFMNEMGDFDSFDFKIEGFRA
jgi:hypothetical protein